MNIRGLITASAVLVIAFSSISFAQTVKVEGAGRWMPAKRQILAVKYIDDNQTSVNMSGTALVPRATGKAEVEFRHGRAKIKLEMEGLGHPQSLGAYYTTYILWAVAPEGQAEMLAELPVDGKFTSDATTKFQSFGLMITAEPHSRVSLPSPVIVAENSLRKGTDGKVAMSRIDYSGDPGTLYVINSPNSPALNADFETSLLLLGARRAVWIAQRADAQTYAEAELRETEVQLAVLEQGWPKLRKSGDEHKNAEKYGALAHDVMRMAEHARSLSIERSAAASLAAERREAGDSIREAQSDADRARDEADRALTEADRARRSERDAAARADSDAEAARMRVAQAQSEADRARANEAAASDDADRSRDELEQAKRDRDAAQQRLYISLSEILETRREARGLIVNLSDVLFDTGQSTLKPGAREKLSKLAGILIAYPGFYRIEIEGHTDSVGTEGSNITLSQGRADSVHEYLMNSGVKHDRMMAARGLGETSPVATNDTAAGRQVNRRVEIIIGETEKQAKAGN